MEGVGIIGAVVVSEGELATAARRADEGLSKELRLRRNGVVAEKASGGQGGRTCDEGKHWEVVYRGG